MSLPLAAFLREELGHGADATSWHVAGRLWQWQPKAKDAGPSSVAWFFVTIDGEVAEAIRLSGARRAAWGSVYVTATVGATTWQTSLFPSKEAGGYMLPVKAGVRKAEKLTSGDMVALVLALHG